MNNEMVSREMNRDIVSPDQWTDKDDDTLPMDSSLEFERWKWSPEAKIKWDDLGKDAAGANLDKPEMLSIKLNEVFISNLEALRSLAPSIEIGDFFFPESLMAAAYRRNASTEVLSLGKNGFLRTISQTKISHKGYSMDGSDPTTQQEKPEQKMKWMLWKKGAQK